MSRADRRAVALYCVASAFVAVAIMASITWSEWLRGDCAFPARWHCGAWSPELGWTHVASDTVIWLSYLAIPLALVGLRREVVRLANPVVAAGFVAFIAACGFGHALEVVTMWTPIYRISGPWKALTAIASVGTAVSTGFVVRRAQRASARMQDQMAALELSVAELEAQKAELSAIVDGIAPRSGE